MKSPRKPPKAARPAEQRPPQAAPNYMPLKPLRGLLIATSILFALWVLALLAMYLHGSK